MSKIITYALSALLVTLGGYAFLQKREVKNLNIEIDICKTSVADLEALLRVKPFEAIHKENLKDANDEINKTISNNSSVDDGAYKL